MMLSSDELLKQLEQRLGREHAHERVSIEADHEAQVFGQGLNFFHIENLYSFHSAIRTILKMTGLYWRGRRNAERIVVKRNEIAFADLPASFDGFTILHISDMHADMNKGAMRKLATIVEGARYDACVLTGDFRGRTFGAFDETLSVLSTVCLCLKRPILGVLGNHDSIKMVPGLEAMGIKMLVNEVTVLSRGNDRLYMAGIDDAHFFRMDDIEKTASQIPSGAFSILLSHTPEIYRRAACSGYRLVLAGHTHGGQICLPGSIPITLDSVLPRKMGAGLWQYRSLIGYTSVGVGSSVVPVRLNCLPEIAFHTLRRG
jgi:uncharacterized protein